MLGKVSLVLVFLVILAGAVVRMTGSGMGCPDWPKCFGYYIPPTETEQLVWKPNHDYLKGQMILGDDQLLVATEDFTSSNQYEARHWHVYTKHDYATFNPTHTWIEYINRLFGALSGVPVLLLFLWSLWHIRKDGWTFMLSVLALFALGFVAWLGKLVVDGNLIPHSITYHMFGALAVMLLLVGVVFRHQQHADVAEQHRYLLKFLTFSAIVLSCIQVYLGTSVRENVDVVSKLWPRAEWIDQLGVLFLIHRSFSIVILLMNGWLIYVLQKAGGFTSLSRWLAGLIIAVVLAGVFLNYAGFPAWAQPIHLLGGMLIAAIQGYLLLRAWAPNWKFSAAG